MIETIGRFDELGSQRLCLRTLDLDDLDDLGLVAGEVVSPLDWRRCADDGPGGLGRFSGTRCR